MREIYINPLGVKNLFNPKRDNAELQTINNSRLNSKNASFYKYPEGHIYHPTDTNIPIYCNVILTNENHDGIWLFANRYDNEVKLPRGIMTEDQIDNLINNDYVRSIYETILRVLLKNNRDIPLDDYIIDDSLNVRLYYILKMYRLSVIRTNFPIYFNYYIEGFKDELNLFLIIEVDKPSIVVPPMMGYEYNGLLWYSRTDHNNNIKCISRGRRRFNDGYCKDVRNDEFSVLLLDKLFNTEKLFGKINIY